MGSPPGSNNGGGPLRKKTCKNGHDLAEHGVQLWKTLPDGRRVKNGRECRACKKTPEARAKDNESHKRRYREQKIRQAIQETGEGA